MISESEIWKDSRAKEIYGYNYEDFARHMKNKDEKLLLIDVLENSYE